MITHAQLTEWLRESDAKLAGLKIKVKRLTGEQQKLNAALNQANVELQAEGTRYLQLVEMIQASVALEDFEENCRAAREQG